MISGERGRWPVVCLADKFQIPTSLTENFHNIVTIDGTSFPIYPNADKTFMMAAIDDADSHEFVIVVKPERLSPRHLRNRAEN